MYPPGHPSPEPAAINVTDRVTYLLKERGTLSLGAAKDQLVIQGVGTDVNNALLRELAGWLGRHHLGAISFPKDRSGTEFDEARAHMFTAMVGEWEPRLSTLHGEETPPVAQHFPAPTDQDSGPPE